MKFLRNIFKHKHKWQIRARSRYQNPTYRVCLSCGQAQRWFGYINGGFVNCKRMKEFDDQFDENNNFIFGRTAEGMDGKKYHKNNKRNGKPND